MPAKLKMRVLPFLPIGEIQLINDRSTVLAEDSPGTAGPKAFWNPDYNGVSATGNIVRINRLLVGGAALAGGDLPDDPIDYMRTAGIGNGIGTSQFASLSALGTLGVTGASRTGDLRAWLGGHSGGSQGVNGFAINDDVSGGYPIACGMFGLALHYSGCTGATIHQFTIGNAGATVDVKPFGGAIGGSTIGLITNPGWNSGAIPYTNDCSAGIYVAGQGGGGARWRRGIVFGDDALVTSIGTGGAGMAIAMTDQQSIAWHGSTDNVRSELWADDDGIQLRSVWDRVHFHSTLATASRIQITNQFTGTSATAGFHLGQLVSGSAIAYVYNTEVADLIIGTANATALTIFGTGSVNTVRATQSLQAEGKLQARVATVMPAGGATTDVISASSTTTFGVYWGSGAPTVAAAKGSLYLRSDGGGTTDRAYINTNGGSTWTALTTVA